MPEPWTDVLDYACVWADGETEELGVVKKITTNAYWNFGKNYDGTRSHAEGTTFKLTELLQEDWADCRDMSATVHVFAKGIGCSSLNVRRIDGPFVYKPIKPIGMILWQVDTWNFHQVANYSGIYDACLQLDPSNPRISLGEDINGTYKNDLFDSGVWLPGIPFSYTEVK